MNHKEININRNFTVAGIGISLAVDLVFYEVAANKRIGNHCCEFDALWGRK